MTPSAPSGHLPFRVPAKILRSKRFAGRGAASRAVKPRGTQRRTYGLCGDAGGKGDAVAATRRQGNGETPAMTPSVTLPGLTTPPSCLRQATVSRGRDRARSGNGTLHVPFPSSQVVKATPWLCQESTCSPPKPTPKKYFVFFWGPRGEAKEKKRKGDASKTRSARGDGKTSSCKFDNPSVLPSASHLPLHRGG